MSSDHLEVISREAQLECPRSRTRGKVQTQPSEVRIPYGQICLPYSVRESHGPGLSSFPSTGSEPEDGEI